MHLKHEFLLLFLLIPIFDVCSGTYTRTSFRNSAHVSNLINDSVIQLDIERYETVKLFGDQFPGTEDDTTFYPDVFVSGDTFSFFFVDSCINRINRVDIRPDGYHYEPVSKIFRRVHSPSYCYLHSDNAGDNFMLTYINNPGTVKRVLNVFTESDSSSIDSTTTGWLYSSQCHMENDTFLVTYSIGIKKLLLTKVYARGNNIQIIKTETVTQSDTLGNAMNCSAGYDGNGTILVSWMIMIIREHQGDLRNLLQTALLIFALAGAVLINYYGYLDVSIDPATGKSEYVTIAWPWYVTIGFAVAFSFGYLLARPVQVRLPHSRCHFICLHPVCAR